MPDVTPIEVDIGEAPPPTPGTSIAAWLLDAAVDYDEHPWRGNGGEKLGKNVLIKQIRAYSYFDGRGGKSLYCTFSL